MSGSPVRRCFPRLAGVILLLAVGLTGATSSMADDNFPPGGAIPLGWATSPDADAGWVVASDSTNQGPFSLKSAAITNSSDANSYHSAAIEAHGTFAAGTVSFAYQVSSEACCDFFTFYIDDAQMLSASGEVSWAPVSFFVTAGVHTFKWVYTKDAYDSSGADAAWIDSVVLPSGTLQMLLNVKVVGSGAGTVTSVPAGIDCPATTCAEYLTSGSTITLTATPGAGNTFAGWSGDCAGTVATCMLTMSNANSVTANFATPEDNFPPGGQRPVGWGTSPGADAGWVVASDSVYQGGFSLKSATITTEQSAATEVHGNFASGKVSFAYQVSSEGPALPPNPPCCDLFTFYIDDVGQQLQPAPAPVSVSGEVPWTPVSFDVPAGVHTFKWVYTKDNSESTGADAAWIDSVVLPSGTLQMLLNVKVVGSGTGTVTSVPAGIDCPATTCAEYLTSGSMVTLTATPGAGTAFVGWSGDCAGAVPSCVLTMSNAKSVTATFTTPDDNFPPGGQMPIGWTTAPGTDSGWVVASDTAYHGLYSLKSANIGDFGLAGVQVAGTFLAGNASFAYHVSSEEGFDFFKFYIDDVEQLSASGEVAWTQSPSFAITAAGAHTFKWVYAKDGTNSAGADKAWIDSVLLPTAAVLDIDASITATEYDAPTDGLLAIRYLSGLTGTPLTAGALGATATRTDPAAIKAYLDGIRPALDIDGSGTADALTDGLLIIRYLSGIRGDALIAGAVDPAATRKTATAIETYIQTLMP